MKQAVAFLIALLVPVTLIRAADTMNATRPNVILIMTDDQG